MAILKSKYKYMLDEAARTTLVDRAEAAETSSFNSDEYVFDKLDGYWNTDELADQTMAVVINAQGVTINTPTATATLDTVVNTDELVIDDGVAAPVTFTAVASGATANEFNVGADDEETAANLAEAINANATLTVEASADGAVVTITNPVGFLADAEVTTPDTTITVVDFEGGNETYSFAIQVGPEGFSSNTVLGTIPVTEDNQYVFLIDMDTLSIIDPDVEALRLACTIAGDSPSIDVHAWVAKIIP